MKNISYNYISYATLFKIRFIAGLQYRAAAWAGIATQFAWGFMEILAFAAFYRASPDVFPMEFSHLVSYIWIQQAFLALFAPWGSDVNAAETIINGNIAYEMSRPLSIYNRWFFEKAAIRVSRTALRCLPILIVAFILPEPFGMTLPSDPFVFLSFILSAVLGLCVVTSYSMLDSISVFYTMNRYNAILVIFADFLAGGYIPLPFFPEPLRKIAELLPFAAMQNTPLRIYSGNISGNDTVYAICLQLFWFIIMLVTGKILMRNSLKRVLIQGG
ncbi:MAG: ABC-2 family transporter protein [Oscillospiraceae bacterium]|nr:ABC-2 family transporter protein [Oscillospiraceae bacterium]